MEFGPIRRRSVTGPIGVELLHADADGILDLVAVHEYSDDVRVYPGLGDGNFGEGTSYPVGDRPLGMEAVDFDNDTLVDIVVPSLNGDLLALLKNNGDGSFTALASIGLADGPNQVKAGDFNGDAFPDLAVTNYNNGNGGYHISVLLGNGAAGFTEIEVGQGLSPAQRPRGLVIGDFDGINGDDMAVGDVNNDRVQIYLNDGAGGFLDPVPYDVDAADVWALETADFDENGTLDLVAAGTYRDRVSLLSGVGDGTFAAYTELVVGWPQEYRQFTVADFDQDGHKDLFLPGTTDLGYARGRGDGTFEPVLRYNSINQMQGIAVGDVNGDGYNDFVGGRVDSDQVLTFLGQPALPLLVDATESRAMHGFGRGFLTDTSDYDYFRFTAEAGQRLVVASEHPIAFGGAGLRIRVLDAAKNVYFSDHGEPTGNRGETNQITFSKTGSYFVEVYYNYQYFGEYRFRATLLEAPIAIESENNNAIGSADGVPLALGVGQLTGTVSGYISWGGGADYNNGDYWSIGNLGEGTLLTLDMSVPGISPLVPVMRIYRGSTEVAVSSPGDPQLSYAVGVGEADTYRFRVTQDGNTAGMSSAYIVDVTAADLVAPLVTMNNLPAEGSAGGFPGPNFSLTFSEDMLASTVNDLGNYEFLGSGGDGTFGDGNEVAYTLMIPSAYGAGLGVGLRITDGPLQADDYRFRAMTGLSDKTNNPLGEEHVRLFTVEDEAGFLTEGRSNGSFGEAEPLAVGGEGAGFDQSFFRRYTTGSGIDSPHSPTLLHLDDTGVSGTADDVLDLVVVNHDTHDITVALGNGDGTFGAATNYPVGTRPIFLTLIDFDGDGDDDVVVASRDSDRVDVFENALDGTLTNIGSPTVGDGPHQIVMGDFDHVDGLDFAVANYYTNVGLGGRTVSVMSGDGAGAFSEVRITPPEGSPGFRPYALAVADVNGDGWDDLLVGDWDTDDVVVFLNDQAGGFPTASYLPLPDNEPSSIRVADMDSDGHLDLVVTNEYHNAYSVLRGNGDGTFEDYQAISLGGNSYQYFHELRDLDGDSLTDILVARDNGLFVTYNRTAAPGPIAVTGGTLYGEVSGGRGLDIGDLNGDGRPDVVVGAAYQNLVHVYLGNGPVEFAVDAVDARMRHVYARGNLTDSSDWDYYRFTASYGERIVIVSEGPPGASSAGRYYTLYYPGGSQVAAVGGDALGRATSAPYLVTVPGTYYLRVSKNYLSDWEYRFRVTKLAPGVQYETENNVNLGNADGLVFEAAAGALTASVAGYLPTNDSGGVDYFLLGNLSPGNEIAVDFTAPELSALGAVLQVRRSDNSVVAGSEAGDAQLAFTVVESDTYYLSVSGNPKGIYSQYLVDIEVGDSVPPMVVAVDLPAEGSSVSFVDSVFGVTFSEDMSPATVVDAANYDLRGAGLDGTFDTADDEIYAVTPRSYSSGLTASFDIPDGPLQPGPLRLTVGTGLTDKLSLALPAPYVRLFGITEVVGFVGESRSNGDFGSADVLTTAPLSGVFDGGFTNTHSVNSGDYPLAVELEDLDGDGNLDAVVANLNADNIATLLGDGSGAFAAPTTYSTGNDAVRMIAFDWNGDGHRDFVVSNRNEDRVYLFQNPGDGTLTPLEPITVGDSPHGLAWGDFDGDSNNDFAVGIFGTNGTTGRGVSVLLGDGTGSFVHSLKFQGQIRAHDVAVGDFDGNGLDDIAATDYDSDQLRVLLATGGGDFAPPVSIVIDDADQSFVEQADFNQDGNLDLVVIGNYDDNLSLLEGNGDGTFQPYRTLGLASGNTYHWFIGTDDIDGDGWPDLAVGRDNGLDLRYNRPGAEIAFNNPMRLDDYGKVEGFAVGDVNGDGRPDLVITAPSGDRLHTLLGNEDTGLADDPQLAGMTQGYGRGALQNSTDVDTWKFSARAGQRMFISAENPGNPAATGRRYRLLNGQGQQLFDFYADYYGRLHSGYTIPYDGSFFLEVRPNYQTNIEYRFAISLFDNAIQYETESNNNTGQADGLGFSLNAGTREAQVFGIVHSSDNVGDYFDLGGLAEGTQISLSLVTPGPERSTLDPLLSIWDSSGATTAKVAGEQGARTLSYTVGAGEGGTFYASVGSGTRDMFARYLMTVQLTDTLPPEITATSLPAEGATTLTLPEGFTLTSNEDLLASTVNELANYELIEAGDDGVFGSSDDVASLLSVSNYTSGQTISFSITDGPLTPGNYRFTASDTITDTFGSALLGDFVRLFSVGQLTGFTTGIAGNNSAGTATELVFVEDPAGVKTGAGRGRLKNGGDRDYWTFSAEAGEVLVLDTQLVDGPITYDLYWRLVTPSGTQLFELNRGTNDWGGFTPIVLPETGDYVFDVRQWNAHYKEYRFRLTRTVAPHEQETEANGAISQADALMLTNAGGVDSGSGYGFIQSTGDLDYFSIGTVDAGKTVFLNVTLPNGSDFNPVVALYNSGGQLMAESNGIIGDGAAEVPINVTAEYVALVRNSGFAATDLMDQYVVSVQVLDTALVNFPNLQVTNLTLPPQVGLQSGDGITFSFDVSNVGTDGTVATVWLDRAVMSVDQTFGNADDIEVALETRTGALANGASYTVNAAATIPDGTVGDYHLLVRTDLNDQVDELYLEGDNTTVSGGTFPVALRAYPDLVVENLTITPPVGGGDWVLDWDLANRGAAVAPGGTKERVRVVNSNMGVVAIDVTRTVDNELAVDATEARSAAVAATAAGNYLVTVTVDADDDLFEHNGTSHGVAEVNAFTGAFQILQYWAITVAPSDAAQGSVQIGVGGTGVSVLDGASVTVTATPDTSVLPYQFAQWRTAGGTFVSAQQSYRFNASTDIDLVAVFQLPTFQVTASVSPAASGSVTGTGSYVYNGTANLAAVPAAGYLFGHWEEGGSNIGSDASLALTVTADRVLTAIFEEANPSHDVTTATLPAGLAVIPGAGTYTNGQVANVSAPASVIDGATEYVFEKFELNGAHFGTDQVFSKTFSTLDAPAMEFVARYTSRPVNPVVASVGVNYTPPVPAADNVIFTLFFDRPMDPGTDPVLELSSVNASAVPGVAAGGTWISATAFESLAVVFGSDNNGSFTLSASGAIDTNGRTMDAAAVFGFEADTIAPENPVLALESSDGNSATVEWNGYAPPIDINGFRPYLLTSDFGSVVGLQPVTSLGKAVRSFRFTGLTPDTDYFVAMGAFDVAGNGSSTVTTLAVFLDSDLPPVVPFTVTATGPDTALVDWSAFDATGLVGFEGFQVFAEISTFDDVAALTPVGTFGAGDSSVELDGLDRGEAYSIAVVGFNRLGERDTAVVAQTWVDPLRGTVTQDLSVGTPGGTETVDVFEDVVISGGATLTIRPGTTMRFATGTSLTIEDGILDAQGTELLPINLTAVSDVPDGTPQRGDWDGLVLQDATKQSILRQLWIRFGKGLQVIDAEPVLDGFYAVWNAGQGIKASGSAVVGSVGAYLALNDIGILAEGTSMVAVSGSVLKNHVTADVQQAGGAVVDLSGNWWGSSAVGTVQGTVTSGGPLAEEPVLYGVAATADGVMSTSNPTLALKLASPNAVAYRLSENSAFPGVLFQDIFPSSTTDLFSPTAFDATFNLSAGGGLKTVYAQFQSVTGEATPPVALDVTFITNGPSINGFNLVDGQVITRPLQVTGSGSAPLGVKRVQFYADGVLVSSNQAASINFRWDMRALAVGTAAARLVVEDNGGTEVSRTVNVVLAPQPPPKPVITSHADGAVVGGGTLNLAGTAEPFVGLRVSRNGAIQGTGQADAAGNFLLTNIGLVEGANDLRVVAFDDLGSTPSKIVTVQSDSGPPVASVLAIVGYTPGSGTQLEWNPGVGEQPSRYRVFWHTAPFADPGTATGMSPLLTVNSYRLTTAADGTTHIGVIGYDGAGNPSVLSNLVSTAVDQTVPAVTISYDRSMPVGPGALGIVLTTSEPLATNPLLTIRPAGASTLSVSVAKTSATTYTATYPVTNLSAASGVATVRVTATDLAGNRSTGVPAGPALEFDVTKPTGLLTFDQPSPVGTSGGDVTVSFNLTLSEAAAAGTSPTLAFTPPVGGDLNPVLAGAGTTWSGQIVVTAAMNNGDGIFNLSAEDGAGNTGTVLTAGEKLEVYNTLLPSPPGVPTNLAGEILSGGRIRINWDAVDRAQSYCIFREPGNGSVTPTVVLVDGLTTTEFIDTTVPADGFYRYAITAKRLGSEGSVSGTLVGFSDSSPPDKVENFAAVLTDEGVVIGYDPPAGGDPPHRYKIYRNGVLLRSYPTARG